MVGVTVSIFEKEYLTFSELCNRWNISDQDMHYLIAKGDLVPSIAWDELLVECRLLWAEGGDEEFSFPNRHKYIGKNGWLYLQLPKPTGHSKYSFGFVCQTLRPPIDDIFSEVPWYMLCSTCEYEGTYPPQRVGETYVATNCVFMAESIVDCESRYPQLAGQPPRETPPEEKSAVQGKWPWGDHETELLRKLAKAAERYWVRYDPTDATTAPRNDDIVEWLMNEEKVSERSAKAIATVLRADGLATGPRR